MKQKPMILVLSTGNCARSQMAEAFVRKYKGDLFDAASAGTQPKESVHPLAIRAMQEIGIEIGDQRCKGVSDLLGKAPVYHLLVLGNKGNDSSPRAWPGIFSRTFMPFDDPAEAPGSEDEQLAAFRRVRDQISDAIQNWTPEPGRGD